MASSPPARRPTRHLAIARRRRAALRRDRRLGRFDVGVLVAPVRGGGSHDGGDNFERDGELDGALVERRLLVLPLQQLERQQPRALAAVLAAAQRADSSAATSFSGRWIASSIRWFARTRE